MANTSDSSHPPHPSHTPNSSNWSDSSRSPNPLHSSYLPRTSRSNRTSIIINNIRARVSVSVPSGIGSVRQKWSENFDKRRYCLSVASCVSAEIRATYIFGNARCKSLRRLRLLIAHSLRGLGESHWFLFFWSCKRKERSNYSLADSLSSL